jgi:hypothetical protein
MVSIPCPSCRETLPATADSTVAPGSTPDSRDEPDDRKATLEVMYPMIGPVQAAVRGEPGTSPTGAQVT